MLKETTRIILLCLLLINGFSCSDECFNKKEKYIIVYKYHRTFKSGKVSIIGDSLKTINDSKLIAHFSDLVNPNKHEGYCNDQANFILEYHCTKDSIKTYFVDSSSYKNSHVIFTNSGKFCRKIAKNGLDFLW